MTMMQKIQAKKSKKGFTLVELVIVIAILAILAAIAIPVITTTINSSKISTMKSDGATTAMLVKEAVNNNLAHIDTTTYNGTPATDDSLTVQTVLAANDIDTAAFATKNKGDTFYSRHIGGEDYVIGWTVDDNRVLNITTDLAAKAGTPFTDDTTIGELAEKVNK